MQISNASTVTARYSALSARGSCLAALAPGFHPVRETSARRELTNCCVNIGQPLLELLLQIQLFFGVVFGKGRQHETHRHGGASHTEEHSSSQLADIQSAVEMDCVAATST